MNSGRTRKTRSELGFPKGLLPEFGSTSKRWVPSMGILAGTYAHPRTGLRVLVYARKYFGYMTYSKDLRFAGPFGDRARLLRYLAASGYREVKA